MLSKMPKNSFSEPESTCRLKRKQNVSELTTSNVVLVPLAFTSEAPPLLPNTPLHKVFLKTFIVSLFAAAVEYDAAIKINMASNLSPRQNMVFVGSLGTRIHVPTKLD